MNDDQEHSWKDYYDAVASRPPHATLMKALSFFNDEPAPVERFAIDLGCGGGGDTFELLRQGWRVLCIDKEASAIEYVMTRIPPEYASQVQTQIIGFEEVNLPRAVLINASLSLPFCPPASFPHLWEQITSALSSGGRFSGHFFGERHAWVAEPNMTFFSRLEVEQLLSTFTVEFFEEEERERQTTFDGLKHYHGFSIVARRD